MSGFRAKPPKGSLLNRADPLANGLVGAWMLDEKGGTAVVPAVCPGPKQNGVYDATPIHASSPWDQAWAFSPIAGYDINLCPTDATGFQAAMPTGACSIVLLHRKTDTTLRASAAFGMAGTGADVNRLGCHLPYSDGSLYFDYGGTIDGTTRLAIAGLTWDTNWHTWVFVTDPASGGQGMRVYRDGMLVGSNTGTPTRTASGNVGFYLNFGNWASANDAAEFAYFAIYNRALRPNQVASVTADPFSPFRRRSLPVPIRVQAAGGTDTPLNAAAGSFTETGSPATLDNGLASGVGTFAETGASATAAIAESVAAGSFALTFAGVTADLTLTQSVGAFSFSFPTATLDNSGAVPPSQPTVTLDYWTTQPAVALDFFATQPTLTLEIP